jgi:hypothetical protein
MRERATHFGKSSLGAAGGHSAMKFNEEYPKAFPHFTTDDGFMKGSGQPSECVGCEGPTDWFHKALGLYFCSRDCHRQYVSQGGNCGVDSSGIR